MGRVMSKKSKSQGNGRIVGILVLVLVWLAVLIAILMQGHNVVLFNPKGLIAHEQLRLTLLTVGIMLVIGIPALGFFYFTAWKYRESNSKVKRDPNAGHSKLLNAGIWLLPTTFALVLALIMWPATHRLEPQKQINADAKPMTIQVVALRWKWLFIYPEQKIATVNYVQVPTGTPVTFELTADDTPMSSFWIPNLGGMLYAMTGHVNKLNLLAETPGEYPGSAAEINGAGFAGMRFTANATSKEDFDRWVRSVQSSPDVLNAAEYAQLLKPSEDNEPALYTVASDDLYDTVLMKYQGAHGAHMQHEAHSE
jgi:cytochrome o ubiquinol oxidase subunit 2